MIFRNMCTVSTSCTVYALVCGPMNYLLAAPTNGQNPSMLTEFERVRKKFGLALLLIGICFSLEATAFQTISRTAVKGRRPGNWSKCGAWAIRGRRCAVWIHSRCGSGFQGHNICCELQVPGYSDLFRNGHLSSRDWTTGQGPGEFNEVHSVYVDDADTVLLGLGRAAYNGVLP